MLKMDVLLKMEVETLIKDRTIVSRDYLLDALFDYPVPRYTRGKRFEYPKGLSYAKKRLTLIMNTMPGWYKAPGSLQRSPGNRVWWKE